MLVGGEVADVLDFERPDTFVQRSPCQTYAERPRTEARNDIGQ
jgi:hypothetical protein